MYDEASTDRPLLGSQSAAPAREPVPPPVRLPAPVLWRLCAWAADLLAVAPACHCLIVLGLLHAVICVWRLAKCHKPQS